MALLLPCQARACRLWLPRPRLFLVCLSSIPNPTLVSHFKRLQNFVSFLGSFGKRYQLLLIWLLSYAPPNPLHCSGTVQPDHLNEPWVLHTQVRMGSGNVTWYLISTSTPSLSTSTPCNTKAHRKGNTRAGSLLIFASGWRRKVPIVRSEKPYAHYPVPSGESVE